MISGRPEVSLGQDGKVRWGDTTATTLNIELTQVQDHSLPERIGGFVDWIVP
jgi:hypothetical protein